MVNAKSGLCVAIPKNMMFCHKKTYVFFRILIVALVLPLCRLTSAPSSPVP